MFKELMETGRLTNEDYLNLREAVIVDEPDFPYASALTIAFIPKKGTFYLSDKHGFLCGIKSVDHLLTILAIAREESLRDFFHFTLAMQEVSRESVIREKVVPTTVRAELTATQVRARNLADEMSVRRFGTPISGDTSDVTPIADASENDTGFSETAAMAALNLDGKLE